jgi:hypothetical protein
MWKILNWTGDQEALLGIATATATATATAAAIEDLRHDAPQQNLDSKVFELDGNLPALPLPCSCHQPISTKGTRGPVALQKEPHFWPCELQSCCKLQRSVFNVHHSSGGARRNFLHLFHIP